MWWATKALKQEDERIQPTVEGRALIARSLTAWSDGWTALADSVEAVEEVSMSVHGAVRPSGPAQWLPALEYASCYYDL
jgi:hypothetical protein